MKRVAAIIGMSVAGLLLQAGPAHAEEWADTAQTTGASATCTVQSWDGPVHDDEASIDCSLDDTSADKHSVYIEWWQDGYAKKRFESHDGSEHTTTHHDARYNPDGSFGTLYWRVCRDVQLRGDNCSDTVEHETQL